MKSIVPAFLVTVILVGLLVIALDVRRAVAGGTIYIRADGSVEPSGAPIMRSGSTYTFTDNINASIEVQRSNIVVDGNGRTLLGSGNLTGIYIRSGVNNVTVKNTTIRNFWYGIFAHTSSVNTFSGNCLTANTYYGLYLYNSSSNRIFGNNITANNRQGIYLTDARDNNISGNTITANDWFGISFGYSSGNSVNGNNITANGEYGVFLIDSFNDTVSDNILAANWFGVALDSSSNNTVKGNTVTANSYHGVVLGESSGNRISGNTITANSVYGMWLRASSNNSISDNTVTANPLYGIWLNSSSNYNNFSRNIISNSYWGIWLGYSSNNRFCHNHIIDNAAQVGIAPEYANVWDDGYPLCGNYWSDYIGVDVKSGPSQDQPGSDGVGDTPYFISTNNTDTYPLMSTSWSSTMGGENVTVNPANDVCITFENVTEGLTAVEEPDLGPTPPPGVSILQYYVIVTTADYTGQITIKIVFNESISRLANPTQEGDLRLLQCVMLTGDVDEDYDVDIFDLVRLAGVYGVVKPDPRYAPSSNCDLDGDGDIDIFDVVQLAGNYGKEWQAETGWADITTWFDLQTNSIFGVTQHLSIFGVTRS